MRKILVSSLVFVLAWTFFVGQKAYSAIDSLSSPRPAVWRSSRTASADSFVLLASTAQLPIHFHGIVIGSATLNITDSRIVLFNSTSTNLISVGASTALIVDLGDRIYAHQVSSSTVYEEAPRIPIIYDIIFSSGIVYNKQGASDINILYEFIPSKTYPGIPWVP